MQCESVEQRTAADPAFGKMVRAFCKELDQINSPSIKKGRSDIGAYCSCLVFSSSQ